MDGATAAADEWESLTVTIEEWFSSLCAALVVAGLAALALIAMAGSKPKDDDSEWWI